MSTTRIVLVTLGCVSLPFIWAGLRLIYDLIKSKK